jgi:hypothetical protein
VPETLAEFPVCARPTGATAIDASSKNKAAWNALTNRMKESPLYEWRRARCAAAAADEIKYKILNSTPAAIVTARVQ